MDRRPPGGDTRRYPVASASQNGSVRLRGSHTGTCNIVIEHPKVALVAIEHDGTWLASAGLDGTIRTWDIGTDGAAHGSTGRDGRPSPA